MTHKTYDFVIIGSGIAGLECAYILASEGYSVVVLEKNKQLGGNLQVFSRDKCLFDTGVHYIGSLDKGECLNQFFKYFNLIDKLKFKRLDDDCFDLIRFNDGSSYKLGQGYDKFKSNLYADFPKEKEAIDAYCDKLQKICSFFPLYNLRADDNSQYLSNEEMFRENTADYISQITKNEKLRAVLAGNNPLYAGIKSKSPLFVHALITNSYIMGSYRLADGGSQIAIHLTKSIKAFGGEVLKRKNVVGANYNSDGSIMEVITDTGETFKGKNFISNVHPAVSIDIFGASHFTKAYRSRLSKLPNTISSFSVHLVFKKNSFKQFNYNIYQHFSDDVWSGVDYNESNWPLGLFISTPATSKSDDFASGMSVMTYMKYDEVKQWEETYNTVDQPNDRGASYQQFKEKKEQQIISKLEEVIPDIRSHIISIHSSTPLTFRDYIGDATGSLYGIMKDSNSPFRSLINAKTKVPNLYLTGQNLILHGILGSTIGAFVTCFNFIDKETLINKVNSIK